ncbi:tetratricopeptide repeat protein [Streptacidiphilus sp. EB129]|uniref:tetratricopeptide repeat protein n=1 Tax=Streptacidiphilus sp. EB129 TaxID=3156262 RepID=UPI0035140BC9
MPATDSPSAPQIRIDCPQCNLQAVPDTLHCPGCEEDLAPLAHLLLRGRISYNQALALARDGDHAAARPLLEQSVREEPELTPAWLLLGKVAARLGDTARAHEALDRAVALAPDDPCAQAARAALPTG